MFRLCSIKRDLDALYRNNIRASRLFSQLLKLGGRTFELWLRQMSVEWLKEEFKPPPFLLTVRHQTH